MADRCPRCGLQLLPTAAFCPRCGLPRTVTPAPAAPGWSAPAPAAPGWGAPPVATGPFEPPTAREWRPPEPGEPESDPFLVVGPAGSTGPQLPPTRNRVPLLIGGAAVVLVAAVVTVVLLVTGSSAPAARAPVAGGGAPTTSAPDFGTGSPTAGRTTSTRSATSSGPTPTAAPTTPTVVAGPITTSDCAAIATDQVAQYLAANGCDEVGRSLLTLTYAGRPVLVARAFVDFLSATAGPGFAALVLQDGTGDIATLLPGVGGLPTTFAPDATYRSGVVSGSQAFVMRAMWLDGAATHADDPDLLAALDQVPAA